MEKIFWRSILAASVGFLAWTGTARAVLIDLLDNGFESPDMGSGAGAYETDQILNGAGTGWIWTTSGAGYASGIIANGATFTLGSTPNVLTGATNGNADGTMSTGGQAAFLSAADTMSQSFTLSSAAQVSVSFAMESGRNDDQFNIFLGTTQVGTNFKPTSTTTFQTFTTTAVTLAAGTYTLKFVGLDNSSLYTAFIDNVQIDAEPVPEPDVLGLGIGAGLLLLVVRRNRPGLGLMPMGAFRGDGR